MLARIVVSASLVVFAVSQAPAMLVSVEKTMSSTSQLALPLQPLKHVGRAILVAGPDGHFTGRFTVNGRVIDGIVDNGATFVALNEGMVRDIGIRPNDLVYDHTVATAGGDIKAARVTLSDLSIGDVSISEVDALVVAGDALPSALIGVSFLGRLSSYTVDGDAMSLVK
ncbi:TIGR02281 family clan AA aspartic protease [Endobacterium cereale]|nr:TIGR02281 family clan AA aspartic protease [Endobacterium cereale]MEB2845150.1 TIGR02281 family clan AA aspartic protease [Endobacterium cereale]